MRNRDKCKKYSTPTEGPHAATFLLPSNPANSLCSAFRWFAWAYPADDRSDDIISFVSAGEICKVARVSRLAKGMGASTRMRPTKRGGSG